MAKGDFCWIRSQIFGAKPIRPDRVSTTWPDPIGVRAFTGQTSESCVVDEPFPTTSGVGGYMSLHCVGGTATQT